MANELTPDQIAEENRGALVIDHNADEVVESRQPAGDADKPEGAEKPKREIPVRSGPFDDKRKAIIAKSKAMRAGPDSELEADIAATQARLVGDNVDIPNLREEPKGEGEKPTPQAPAKHKLKVNGREIELDTETVFEHARKSLASEDILAAAKNRREEATTLLEEVRQLRANPGQPAAATPEPKSEAKPALTPADDADLDEVVDRIQVGSPEEAKAALEKYGDRIERRLMAKIGNLDETIARTVDHITESRDRQEATRSTLAAFGADNEEFRNSASLQGALALEGAATMRTNMKAIGVEDGVLTGYMDRVRKDNPSFNEIQLVGHAYRFLQGQGYELPSHRDVLDKSATAIRQQMGLPPKTPKPATPTHETPAPAKNLVPPERLERKREMTPQPRRASITPNLEAQERSREEKARAAVAQMRAHRRGGRA